MFGRRGAQVKKIEEQPMCEYDVVQEGRLIKMVTRCKECGGAGGLDNQACLTGVLKALTEEENVDILTLAHFVERQYFGDAMVLLKKIVQVGSTLDQLSVRPPALLAPQPGEDASKAEARRKRGVNCPRCAYNPQILFPMLKSKLYRDIGEFYAEFGMKVSALERATPTEGCAPCIETTIGDFVYLHNQLEDLRTYILYMGFKIIT
ncbi:MAG: hypothetical protein N3F63_03350 [Thermoplasmata archaeon]|nr:hypothetical protein [Thermoplasmata archaeon]